MGYSNKFKAWSGLTENRPKQGQNPEEILALARQRSLRTSMVMAFISALIFILGYRFIYWQVIMRDEVLMIAKQHSALEPISTEPRGAIRDTNGYLLASDRVTYKLWVSPDIASYPQKLAKEVGLLIDREPSELEAIFTADESSSVLVAEDIPYTVGQKLVNMNELSFVIEPVLTREYPNGSLAAHLLGFVNAERRGLAGIEMYHDRLLAEQHEFMDDSDKMLSQIQLGHRPFRPNQGVELVLTIDRSIQFIVEQELAHAIEEYKATSGTILLLNPKTGDLLASASFPTYEPNHYANYVSDPSIFQDSSISIHYEPGSVFKLITVAAALDAGLVSPDTIFDDKGFFEVGGRIIKNWDEQAYGPSTVTEILGYSLNTGTTWLNTQLGETRFSRYLDLFGFGKQTGIDLANEALGIVKHPGDGLWHPSDLGTNSFGQGIAVTPLQLTSAVAALLNDGLLMRPRVVKAIIKDGELTELLLTEGRPTVSPQVANLLQSMMVEAVEMRTLEALIEGFSVGGKSGTAQVPIPGGYHATDTIASFIGFAPARDPIFIMLVKLDHPQGEFQWGSRSAAPTFRRVAQRVLNYLNIPPDKLRKNVRR